MQFQAVSRHLYPSRVAGSEWRELKAGSLVALCAPSWLPGTLPSICRVFQNAGGKPVTAAVQTITLSARWIWICDSSKSLTEPGLPNTHLCSHESEPGSRLRLILFWAWALHHWLWEDGSSFAVWFVSSCSGERVEGHLLFINSLKVLGRLLGLWLRGN